MRKNAFTIYYFYWYILQKFSIMQFAKMLLLEKSKLHYQFYMFNFVFSNFSPFDFLPFPLLLSPFPPHQLLLFSSPIFLHPFPCYLSPFPSLFPHFSNITPFPLTFLLPFFFLFPIVYILFASSLYLPHKSLNLSLLPFFSFPFLSSPSPYPL